MDIRVVLLCVVTAYGQNVDHKQFYRSQIGSEHDSKGENSEVNAGFVQPLDFASFTQQFFGGSENILPVPFTHFGQPEVFGAESKKAGVLQPVTQDFIPFSGSPFPDESKQNSTGFVQPVRFVSSFDGDGANSKIYRPELYSPSPKNSRKLPKDQAPKATDITEDDEDEDDSVRVQSPSSSHFRPASKSLGYKRTSSAGKSSYPSPHQSYKSDHSPTAYYPVSNAKQKDVEVFLPKEKAILLPMVNGKPKPYDGYRAAPEVESYDGFDSEDDGSEKGEIIYGRPKPGREGIVLAPYTPKKSRSRRSPAEYHGSIYPHYDYSDPTHTSKTESRNEEKTKKAYPKKHKSESTEKPYNQYKYPKGNTNNKKVNKNRDSQGHATEENPEEIQEEEVNEQQEQEPEQEEQEQEPEQGQEKEQGEQEQGQEQEQEPEVEIEDVEEVPHKYRYENKFKIPKLKVKRYPFERTVKDSQNEGTTQKKRSSGYYDEFTADYEKYKKSLPSDLEKHFGSPNFDEYTVAATQNLEKNKNCEKIEKAVTQEEAKTGKAKREADNDKQVCYICTDPKTGGSYEQCAYESAPQSQKFFYGGTTSYKSKEKSAPVSYRYRRSPYDPFSLEHFIFGDEPDVKRKIREDIDSLGNYPNKPKKSIKKKQSKNQSRKPKYQYNSRHPKKYDPSAKIEGAPTSYSDESSKVEGPPESYDGPRYTYEGPSRPYEGPAETYEGPSEPYEGPINQEYYDTTDERLEDDEYNAPKQEHQGSAPKESKYNRLKPTKPRGYSVKHSRPYRGPKSEIEEFNPYPVNTGYVRDYRFGPEHFTDDDHEEPTKSKEELKSESKKGPQKFQNNEEKTPSASTEAEDKEFVGHVRVYKNGDVCQKKKKDGMICMVCKNEKTAATYEQCQYSSKPKDKYYAFGSQKSYSSSKAPNPERHERNVDNDQHPEKSDIVEKKILITKESKVFGDEAPESLVGAESRDFSRLHEFLFSGDLLGSYSENSETLSDDPRNSTDDEEAPSKNTEHVERIEPRDGVEGLEEYLYGGDGDGDRNRDGDGDGDKEAESSEKKESEGYKSYDDYFHHLFPEFSKKEETEEAESEESESETEEKLAFDPFSNIREFREELAEEQEEYTPADISDSPKKAEASNDEPLRLKDKGSRIPPEFLESHDDDDFSKKDLEKALGEFQNRDWSNCKKIVKNRLTCYQCVDKNGVNNEECMYVEASQPISKHLAYHEKKELMPEVPEKKTEAESQKNEQKAPPTNVTDEEAEGNYRKRKPKYSRPETPEVTETPQESINSEKYLEKKGEFEDTGRPSSDYYVTTTQVYETETPPVTQKPRIKKNRKNLKKKKYSSGNETTTEKIKKRKYPVKKFNDYDETTVEAKLSDENFGLKNEQINNTNTVNDGDVIKIYFNNTGDSSS